MKKIKVVETRTYLYEPDLDEDCYECPDPLEDGTEREPAITVEAGMEIDKQDVERGQCDLNDFAGQPEVTYTWEVVDVND